MTKIDLEVVKTKKGLEVAKWKTIDRVISRSTLIALWIVTAFLVGFGVGVAI